MAVHSPLPLGLALMINIYEDGFALHSFKPSAKRGRDANMLVCLSALGRLLQYFNHYSTTDFRETLPELASSIEEVMYKVSSKSAEQFCRKIVQ